MKKTPEVVQKNVMAHIFAVCQDPLPCVVREDMLGAQPCNAVSLESSLLHFHYCYSVSIL